MQFQPSAHIEKNTLLFFMASLSPKVQEGLEREMYRVSAESDMSTEQYIIEDAFQNLIRDLEEIGLTFDLPYEDYVSNMMKLGQFLNLCQLLLPNTLYTFMKSDPSLLRLIKDITTGSIGDEDTVIGTYLTELAALDAGVPYQMHLVDFIDEVYPVARQTGTFTEYLKNLVYLLEEERPSEIIDEERHRLYHTAIRNTIARMGEAANTMDVFPEFEELQRLMNICIRDFISADNFVDYAYLFLESKETLPEELLNGYDRKWFQYKVSHPWNYAYYQIRKLKVPRVNQLLIACFTYALCKNVQDYQDTMGLFRESYPDPEIDRLIHTLFQGV